MNNEEVLEYREKQEQKINVIKELYRDKISPKAIDAMAKLALFYGGTDLSNCILDLYDSLIYGEKPKGPEQHVEAVTLHKIDYSEHEWEIICKNLGIYNDVDKLKKVSFVASSISSSK